MNLIDLRWFALSAFLGLAACSSTTTGGEPPDSGPSASEDAGGGGGTDAGGADAAVVSTLPDSGAALPPTPGMDASTAGGLDFAFTNNHAASTTRTAFQVAPLYGSSCTGAAPNTNCSFTGSVTASGCTAILNVAFVGTNAVGTTFPLVANAPVPSGSGFVTYTEVCGATSSTWRATAGTIAITALTPPAQGFSTGSLSFTVSGATLSPAPLGAGSAAGTFDAAGTATQISYTGT